MAPIVAVLDVDVNVKQAAIVSTRTWSIAEIAEELGITHRTVRYYEDLGLISPERRGTLRVFHPRDRIRLELVQRKRDVEAALAELDDLEHRCHDNLQSLAAGGDAAHDDAHDDADTDVR